LHLLSKHLIIPLAQYVHCGDEIKYVFQIDKGWVSMNKSSTASSVIIAFIAGLVIGLVVLGWWLFPVTWTNGSIEMLNPADQQDYLRAAIDSYAVNQDSQLATQRYNALGSYKETALYDIHQAADPAEAQSVENFASAVNATEVLSGQFAKVTPARQPLTAPGLLSGLPFWIYMILAGIFVLLIALLVVLLILRGRSGERKTQAGATITTFDNPEIIADKTSLAETQETSRPAEMTDEQPSEQEFFATTAKEGQIEQGEVPDWLQATPEIEQEAQALPEAEPEAKELSDQDVAEITAEGDSLVKVDDFAEMEEEQPTGPAEAARPPIGEETAEQTYDKFSQDVKLIPGVIETQAGKLHEAGIDAMLLMLKGGATPQGRQEIAEKIGVDRTQVLDWVNFTDLLRVKGLTLDDAQNLYSVAVHALADLASQDASSLWQQICNAGDLPRSIRQPTVERVEDWVKQANQLPRIVID
jgi:hypothetical protein